MSAHEAAAITKTPFSWVSVVALIVPFFCLTPIGLILAVIGLVQTRDARARGRAVAIAALVVNVLVLAFTIVAVAMAPATGPDGREVVTKQNAHQIANDLEKEVDADLR